MANAIPEWTESTPGHPDYRWLLKVSFVLASNHPCMWVRGGKSHEKLNSRWHLQVSGTSKSFLSPSAGAWGRHAVQRHLLFSWGAAPGSALISMKPPQVFLSLCLQDKYGHGLMRCAPTCYRRWIGSCLAFDVLHQKPLNNVYREFLLILAWFKENPSEFRGYEKFCKEYPWPKHSLQKEIRMAW